MIAEARDGEHRLLAVDDPEVHRHQARILPAIGEAHIGFQRALLPLEHLLQVLRAGFGDLTILQLLVQPAAALESALLHVFLPAGFRVAIL